MPCASSDSTRNDAAVAADICILLFFLLAPAAVIRLCSRVRWLGKIGPVLILYLLGLLAGNVFHPPGMAAIQDILSSATVPLAIPLMLFSCTFSRTSTRDGLFALVTGLVCVVVTVLAGYFLFGKDMDSGKMAAGMLSGVYTGGTVNLAALKTMLGTPDEMFILFNSYDMIVSFLYLAFLLGIGIRLFRRVLPNKSVRGNYVSEAPDLSGEEHHYSEIFTKAGIMDVLFLLGVDAVIIGISAGLGALMPQGWFMTVLILMLTTLGIAASFWSPVKTRRHGYDVGMYLIYVFSIVVASMADFSKFDIGEGASLLAYLSFVVFGSLLLQTILARIFRIDADTMVVSSVAYICSPPFVPVMTAAMKNRSVLPGGLATGVLGYALGNYLGFLIFRILTLTA